MLKKAPAAVPTIRKSPMKRPMNSAGTVSLNRQWKTEPTNMSKNRKANMKKPRRTIVTVAGAKLCKNPIFACSQCEVSSLQPIMNKLAERKGRVNRMKGIRRPQRLRRRSLL